MDPKVKGEIEEVFETIYRTKSQKSQALLDVFDENDLRGETIFETLVFMLEFVESGSHTRTANSVDGDIDEELFNQYLQELSNDDDIGSDLIIPIQQIRPSSYQMAEKVWGFLETFRDNQAKRCVAMAMIFENITPYIGIKNRLKVSAMDVAGAIENHSNDICRAIYAIKSSIFPASADIGLAVLEILDRIDDRKTQAVVLSSILRH